MKGSLLRSGPLRAIGRIGRRRLCTSQPGAAAAAAWAELQDEARAALSTPAYARFGMDRFLFGEVLTHGSLAEALAHELGSKFTANDTDKQVRFEELLLHAFTEDPTLADAAAADMRASASDAFARPASPSPSDTHTPSPRRRTRAQKNWRRAAAPSRSSCGSARAPRAASSTARS